jgi:ABC-type transporter Mla subunit MlaD
MRLPIGDPRDALALIGRGPALVEQAFALIPRASALLESAETLLVRADGLVDRIETTRLAADDLVERTDGTLTEANALVVRAAGTIGSIEPTIERAQALLDSFGPSLERLQPTLDRLAETTHPDEVDALVKLIDQLPDLVERLESDVLPMLETLRTVGPDVHDLLDITRELNQMLGKLPGMGRVKRRVEEQKEQDPREPD